MKKRILSLILALSMVLSVLPLGAFAADPTQDLIIGLDGYPVGSEGGSKYCSGNGNVWEYYDSGRILCLNGGAFDFSSTHPQGKTQGTSTTTPVKCAIVIGLDVEITGGIFDKAVINAEGEISGGTFAAGLSGNSGKVTGGAFNGKTGLTTKAHQVTVTNGSVLKVNSEGPRNEDGTEDTEKP